MRGEAMGKIVEFLQSDGEDLSTFDALEFFAREGDWQTIKYSGKVKSLSAWEIDPQFKSALEKNLPNAEIRIGDSYELAKEGNYREKFNFLVIDNPQYLFGLDKEYCEHFEALESAFPMCDSSRDCFIVFNINSKPFDYDSLVDWQERRNNYYGINDASKLDIEKTQAFYISKFKDFGFEVEYCKVFHRNPEYLHYLLFKFRKEN